MTAQVAVVTGANRNPGIGYEIVRGLAQRLPSGSTVILTARNPAMGEAAARELRGEGLSGVQAVQLDIASSDSVEAFRRKVEEGHGGIDILVNNAGIAFPLNDNTPFHEQARQTVDVNYRGTKRMMEAFLPLLKPGGRMIGISSSSGQLGSSWAKEVQQRLLAKDLTIAQLDAIAEESVAAAETTTTHREAGFPGSAYGTSKALMTQLHRLMAQRVEAPGLVTAVCPGLCRTHMATGRGTCMSNVLWVGSFFAGSSAAGGADTPLWLALEVSEEERATMHSKFVKGRAVAPY